MGHEAHGDISNAYVERVDDERLSDFFTVEAWALGGLGRYQVFFAIDPATRRVSIAGLAPVRPMRGVDAPPRTRPDRRVRRLPARESVPDPGPRSALHRRVR